ncbi:VanZ family protein [Cohnella zeiphila]|uniref:VanZ family protein n=1 Tax=Cohnella zeiphila TaxID=2761120 RepID=A0A7X0STW1_9BACL|nr:VanZ family protein [Cohnella zeiphila]MBB6734805.1 VanZ family protein [Cohnella zeiphila]
MNKAKSWAAGVLLFFYMGVLFKIIVLKFGPIDVAFLWERLQLSMAHPALVAARLKAGNLIPLKEIAGTFDSMSGQRLFNLAGNIAVFVPFGVLLGTAAKAGKLALARAFWRSFAVSLGLESAQVLFAIGKFDVDDLILNSAGGAFGFLIYMAGTWLTTAGSGVPSERPEKSV